MNGSRSRKAISFLIMVSVVFLFCAPVFSCAQAAEKSVSKPEISAESAYVYCDNTGDTVYRLNSTTKVDPNGAARLMTALLAIQGLSLDKTITVSKTAAAQPGDVLKEGEKITTEQLLYLLLKRSSSDAAYALAENTAGSEAKFVDQMNRTAKDIGCTSTKFKSPSAGRVTDSGGKTHRVHSRTTASDFLLITRVAFSNNTICRMSNGSAYEMPATNKHEAKKLDSVNRGLVREMPGIYAAVQSSSAQVDGEKMTVVAFRNKGMRLYIILFGEPKKDQTEDIRSLVEYAEQTVKGVKAVNAGQKEGKVRIRHGKKTSVEVYAESDGYAYIPKEGSKSLVSTKTSLRKDLEAPIRRGTAAGYVKIYVGNEEVNRVKLIVNEDVGTGLLPSYLGISDTTTYVFLIVLLIFVLFVIYVRAKRAAARRRRRRKRQEKIRRLAEKQLEEEEDRRRRGWDF